jgi:hypothetical protein
VTETAAPVLRPSARNRPTEASGVAARRFAADKPANSTRDKRTGRLYTDHGGVRTDALWLPRTERVRVLTGPLRGREYVSPEAATLALAFFLAPSVPVPSASLVWRTADGDEPLAAARWHHTERRRDA